MHTPEGKCRLEKGKAWLCVQIMSSQSPPNMPWYLARSQDPGTEWKGKAEAGPMIDVSFQSSWKNEGSESEADSLSGS